MATKRSSNNKNEEIVTMDKIRDLFGTMFKKHEENVIKIIAANTKMVNDKLETMNVKINALQESVEFNEEVYKRELLTIKERNQLEIGQFREKLREMEDRSRRNNIRVEGLKESEGENWEQTKEKLRNIIINRLGIKTNVIIERAHRGRAKQNDDNPRPIIAKLLNYEHKEIIMTNARKLKGTGIFINEDFSSETNVIRKRLWEDVKELRKKGKYAILQYDRILSRDFRK